MKEGAPVVHSSPVPRDYGKIKRTDGCISRTLETKEVVDASLQRLHAALRSNGPKCIDEAYLGDVRSAIGRPSAFRNI